MNLPSASTLAERPLITAQAGATSALGLARKRRKSDVSRTSPAVLGEILDRYDAETVFVHAGLSDVKQAFDRNPYEFLRETLTEHFESVLAPGYTPSFKRSGVYHRRYTLPQYGTFSKLSLDDADYRTDDPIHSILVSGSYRFDDVAMRDTFGRDGPFEKLRDDDVLYLNVGIPDFHCTQLHLLECERDPPYITSTDYEGIVYQNSTDHEEVVQTNFTNENPYLYAFNRTKIRNRLERAGVLDAYDLNGLRIYVTRAGAVHRVLRPELEEEPFYLVS